MSQICQRTPFHSFYGIQLCYWVSRQQPDILCYLPGDPFTIQMHQSLGDEDVQPDSEFRLQNGVLHHRDHIYVLEGHSRLQVLKLCHDLLLTDHFGQVKTWSLFWGKFWWLVLHAYIKKYVKSCDLCFCTKCLCSTLLSLFQLLPVPVLVYHVYRLHSGTASLSSWSWLILDSDPSQG